MTRHRGVAFYGNPQGGHLSKWAELYRLSGAEVVDLFTVHECRDWPYGTVRRSRYGVGLWRYVIAGFLWRRTLRSGLNAWCHAHCVSGYGLAVLMGGRPYALTTYGSEIWRYNYRSWLYRKVVSLILEKARAVTATSPEMRRVLGMELGVAESRIAVFSTGVDTALFAPVDDETRRAARRAAGIGDEEIVVLLNRSVAPNYRTLEVLDAFAEAMPHLAGAPMRLVVLCGAFDKEYLKRVEARIRTLHLGNVTVIRDYVSMLQMAGWLKMSDCFVSIPLQDQLGASVLEGMACGLVGVLSDIPSYREVGGTSGVVKAGAGVGLVKAIVDAVRISRARPTAGGCENRRWVVERCSTEAILPKFRCFLEGAGACLA